jgi:hypothetical protein
MKFLTKLGQIVLKVTEIVVGFGPLAGALIPGTKDDAIIARVADTFTQVSSIIQQVEVSGQALGIAGPDKLKMAAPSVAQVYMQAFKLAGHEIANQPLFLQGATKVADGFADMWNAQKDDVKTA